MSPLWLARQKAQALDAITDSGTQLVILIWVGLLATAWLVLHRDRNPDNRRPPIVGVQKHGRIYYVRKDELDASEAAGQANRPTNHDWPTRAHRSTESDERGKRQQITNAAALAVITSLLAGVALFGQ